MNELRPFFPLPNDEEETEGEDLRRRTFLGWLLGIGTLAVGTLLSIPLVRFALYPLTTKTTETIWSDLGAVDEFESAAAPVKKVITITQIDGWRKMISDKSVYVYRDESGKLKVFSAICPHLGCSVRWNEDDSNFLCPCHTGIFASNGQLVSGPPPRGMDELESRIAEGRLEVHYQLFRQLIKTKEVIA